MSYFVRMYGQNKPPVAHSWKWSLLQRHAWRKCYFVFEPWTTITSSQAISKCAGELGFSYITLSQSKHISRTLSQFWNTERSVLMKHETFSFNKNSCNIRIYLEQTKPSLKYLQKCTHTFHMYCWNIVNTMPVLYSQKISNWKYHIWGPYGKFTLSNKFPR